MWTGTEHALAPLWLAPSPGHADSTAAEIEFYLDSYYNKPDMVTHIATLGLEGGDTYTALGMRTLQESVFTEAAGFRGNMTIVIVVTDGIATDAGLIDAQRVALVGMVRAPSTCALRIAGARPHCGGIGRLR